MEYFKKILKEILMLILFASIFLVFNNFITRSVILAISIVRLLAFVILRFQYKYIEIKRVESHIKYTTDKKCTITIIVANKSLFPIHNICIYDNYRKLRVVSKNCFAKAIKPFSSRKFITNLTIPSRGLYTIGPVLLKYNDPFLMHRTAKEIPIYCEIISTPQIIPINFSILDFMNQNEQIKLNQYVDTKRDIYISNYRRGDNIKFIDWNRSDGSNLYKWNFGENRDKKIFLILDLNKSNYTLSDQEALIEHAISTTSTLAFHLINNGNKVGLISNGSWNYEEIPMIYIPPKSKEGQLSKIMNALSLINPIEDSKSIADLLNMIRLEDKDTIKMIISTKISRKYNEKISTKYERIVDFPIDLISNSKILDI